MTHVLIRRVGQPATPAIYVATRLIGRLQEKWSVSPEQIDDDLIVLRISAAGMPAAEPVEQAEIRVQFEAEADSGWELEFA